MKHNRGRGSGGETLAAVLGFNARRPIWLPISRLSLHFVVFARPCRRRRALFPFHHCVKLKGCFLLFLLLLLLLLLHPLINQLLTCKTPGYLFPNTLGCKDFFFFFFCTSVMLHSGKNGIEWKEEGGCRRQDSRETNKGKVSQREIHLQVAFHPPYSIREE